MRERKASRLLVINPAMEVLLFRFVHKEGPLAGKNYWATPGGGVEEGETFEAAAIRELREETGIKVQAVQLPLAENRFPMMLPSGETVLAVEQYFLVHVPDAIVSRAEWTLEETQVMEDHHWWSAQALRLTSDRVWPDTLDGMLVKAGVFESAA